MIKIHPNPKHCSYAQCNRCGRKVYSFGNTEEEIKKEARLEGWTFWDHDVCFCEDCTKVVEEDDE